MHRTPDLSVVIHPRERLSGLDACMRSLVRATDDDTEYIVVDQGYAAADLARAEEAARGRAFRVVHDGTFLSEGAARNIGLAASKSPAWVLLVDGEMTIAKDGVRWLRRAADETGAVVVQPLLLERKGLIHTTGGKLVYPDTPDGPIDQAEGHYYEPVAMRNDLQRQEIEMVETHLLLIDRHTTGPEPFEWKHIHLFHIDFSLTCAKNGWKVVMEPRALAMFKRPPPISWSDYQFFSLRWNDERFREDSLTFQQKWGYDIRTANLALWEEELKMSLFPPALQNRWTQPLSNAYWWARKRAGELRREWRFRALGGAAHV